MLIHIYIFQYSLERECHNLEKRRDIGVIPSSETVLGKLDMVVKIIIYCSFLSLKEHF